MLSVDLPTEQPVNASRAVAEYRADACLAAGDATERPVANDTFDLAFAPWAFQVVGSLDACFAEATRALRDDRPFVFDTPHPSYGVPDPERCGFD